MLITIVELCIQMDHFTISSFIRLWVCCGQNSFFFCFSGYEIVDFELFSLVYTANSLVNHSVLYLFNLILLVAFSVFFVLVTIFGSVSLISGR
jgi:hypothetical protein